MSHWAALVFHAADRYMTGMSPAIGFLIFLATVLAMEGFACSPYYSTKDVEGNVSLELRTLFSQEMIRNNVLMPWVALSFAHGEAELDMTFKAARAALTVYRQALEKGVGAYLQGRAIKPVFRKYN